MNCRNPTELVDDSTTIIGYSLGEPAIRGANLTFTCTSGLVLSGPNTSTCMGNGEWEPDPREIECTGISMHVISEKSLELLSRDGEIAVASSVTIITFKPCHVVRRKSGVHLSCLNVPYLTLVIVAVQPNSLFI